MIIHKLLILCLVSNLAETNYFCSFACGKNHTACVDKCAVSPKCGNDIKGIFLNDIMRRWIVDIHNDIRNKAAFDEGASNINAISYSKEMEYVAQCWANSCRTSHDVCRVTSEYKEVDQNLYIRSSTDPINPNNRSEFELAIKVWFNDEFRLNEDFTSSNKIIHHAVHYLWSDTKHVGCGYNHARKNEQYLIYIICNYGPSLSQNNGHFFQPGKPCSNCSEPCNTDYKGLCGVIQPLKGDHWLPPYFYRRMEDLRRRSNDGNVVSVNVVPFTILLLVYLV